MNKRIQVIMLPTNEKAPLCLEFNKLVLDRTNLINCANSWQHLYFISDEEIKEGDWYYNIVRNTIQQYKNQDKINEDNWKKIIATTDKSLEIVSKGINPVYEKLPQLPRSFIEHFVSEYNHGNIITEVMVEYNVMNKGYNKPEDYPYQECETLKINQDNTITITKVKDSYNLKEIEEIHVAVMKQGCLYEGGSWDNEYERLVRLEFNKWVTENL